MTHNPINILIELNKAVKSLNFYPDGHPKRGSVITELYDLVKETAKEGDGIRWTATNKGIFEDGEPIAPSNPAVQTLTRLFFSRKIHVINITQDIRAEDIMTLLKILNTEPEDVFSCGGVEKMLAMAEAHGILLNEISYEDLEKLKEEEEEEEVEEEEEPEEEEEEEEEEKKIEESLLSLLIKIDPERDQLKYNDLALRIQEFADVSVLEKNYESILSTLLLFLSHTNIANVEQAELREKAKEIVTRYLSVNIIPFLISKLTEKNEPNRAGIEALLKATGEAGILFLIDELIVSTSLKERRAIFKILADMGDVVRPHAVNRLRSSEWPGTRNIIALLGALGGAESIAVLENGFYESENPLIRKEMLKSLSRIPSRKSKFILVKALEEEDKGIVGQAIISLGIMGEVSVVDTLGEIASKKDRLSENFEIRKEAIKALGFIKDKKAISYLKSILFRKKWFGKETYGELRVLAVISLGKIGGSEAFELIERAYEESTGTLYSTCKRTLEGKK